MSLQEQPSTPSGGELRAPHDDDFAQRIGLGRRVVAALGTSVRAVRASGATLELSLPAQDHAHAQASELLSDSTMRAHAVMPNGDAVFAAFLDGVQESRTIGYRGLVPVVVARCAAVVRARVGRRLVTWGDGARVSSSVALPLGGDGDEIRAAVQRLGVTVLDTSDGVPLTDDVHPQQLLRRAVHAVQRERESLERALAEAWCVSAEHHAQGLASGMLYVDGGLHAVEAVLCSRRAIGVIKSHQTLYATGAALATVMSLGAGERSSIFVVTTKWRVPVASWYLRVRDARGRDPWWGLARVEASMETLQEGSRTRDEWANEISRWVMAESAPLSLPDSRWDTMAYGIRDCEEYLRAHLGPFH